MDNIQKKADAVILEIRRNEQKLEKLGDNLVEEKFRLQKIERKGMNEKLKSIITKYNSAVLVCLKQNSGRIWYGCVVDIPPPFPNRDL